MANNIYTHSDIVRFVARKITENIESKDLLKSNQQLCAKIYTAFSKYISHIFKRAQKENASYCEVDIPSIGIFTRESDRELKAFIVQYYPSQQICDEARIIKKGQYVKQGCQVLLDLRLDEFPSKILVINNSQQDFVDRSSVHNLIESKRQNHYESSSKRSASPALSSRSSIWQSKLDTPKTMSSQTRKAASRGAGGLSQFESDPYFIINLAMTKQAQQNLNNSVALPNITINLGNFVSDHKINTFKKLEMDSRIDQVNQAQQQKERKVFDKTNEQVVDFQRNQEQIKLQELIELEEKQRQNEQKNTLRQQLIEQRERKKLEQQLEKQLNKQFDYQFPFHDKPNHGRAKTLQENLKVNQDDFIKKLPLQHDIQETQHAYRLLKDQHREETDKLATDRVQINLEQLKQQKLREKDVFHRQIYDYHQQEQFVQQARKQNLIETKDTLKEQIKATKTMRENQKLFENSFTSGVQWMDSQDMSKTFNNFGPDEKPERVQYYNIKAQFDKELIREHLKKQMKDKELAKKSQDQDYLDYGRTLNELANQMNRQEQERQKNKQQTQFQQLRQAWDEQKKQKEDLKIVEKIFR
ncbi:UNKNOWN [Stylonychia lemnae]|uniref:Uncharacterized protein n=1 Tax=Stylonychia lemnae TaxID=5949 RepID=A0A078AYD6_STYLE|nr:UNKNOWN [Stylonychia lemnae]|eukprot:CDW86232.1 UNKNOWN [Stylonychia lemnae]